jgi:hypothetical protein
MHFQKASNGHQCLLLLGCVHFQAVHRPYPNGIGMDVGVSQLRAAALKAICCYLRLPNTNQRVHTALSSPQRLQQISHTASSTAAATISFQSSMHPSGRAGTDDHQRRACKQSLGHVPCFHACSCRCVLGMPDWPMRLLYVCCMLQCLMFHYLALATYRAHCRFCISPCRHLCFYRGQVNTKLQHTHVLHTF